MSTDNFLDAPMRVPCTVVQDDPDGQHHRIQQITLQTCEHYFQAVKFDGVVGGRATWEHCRAIQKSAPSPLDAWSLGQSREHPLRADWETVKGHAMYTAVRTKYEQYPCYAEEFRHTSGEIQTNESTSHWQFLNAIVLERVRYELRQAAHLPPLVNEEQYREWCRLTELPSTSQPLMVYLTPT